MEPENDEIKNLLKAYQSNIFLWIEHALSITPQLPVNNKKRDFQRLFTCPPHEFVSLAASFKLVDFEVFQKNKNLTWQQGVLLIAVMRAVRKELPFRIAVRACRGSGKSSVSAIIVLWYLYCFTDTRILATSSSSAQLSTAFWAEIRLHHSRMNEPFKSRFEVQSAFVYPVGNQESFITARASNKENPEVMAGLHAEHLGAVCEEASAIPEEVWTNVFGTTTGENNLLIAISNPTRLDGTYYNAFNGQEMALWVQLHFDGLECPIFDMRLEAELRLKYGIDSAEYRTSVRGDFPLVSKEGDDHYRFFSDAWIENVTSAMPHEVMQTGDKYLGVDVAGDGEDETIGFLRSRHAGKIIFKQAKSTEHTISGAIHSVYEKDRNLKGHNIFNDAFGIGHSIAQRVLIDSAIDDPLIIMPVNVGEIPKDKDAKEKYVNIKAQLYDTLRIAGNNGFKFVGDLENIKEQLKSIHAKSSRSGKLEIMTKKEMRKKGYSSPDIVEAAVLSFAGEADYITDMRGGSAFSVSTLSPTPNGYNHSSIII